MVNHNDYDHSISITIREQGFLRLCTELMIVAPVGPTTYETSLLRNPIADLEKPLEVLRTVDSFDPCMACACHTFDPSGRPVASVKVL